MRSKEIIMNDAMRNGDIPEGYNMIEINCYLCIRQLLDMYNRGEISKEVASKHKNRILKEYEEESKMWDFKYSMMQNNIDNINKTQNSRMELHKILKSSEPINEERLSKTVNVCMDIISNVFEGEF